MKKMLTLVLVLAVASLANAAVTFEEAGPISATSGSTVRLYVVNSALLFSMDVKAALDLTSGAGSVAGAMAADAATYGWDYANYPDTPILTATTAEFGGTQFNNNSNLRVGYLDVLYTSGTVVVNLTGAYGLNAAMTMDENTNEISVADSVTIIPEPITMALLGLGGLFLRRRKSA